MSRKLTRLFHEQGGRCFYCSADTFLRGGVESAAQARLRFGLPAAAPKKLFRRRHATLEHLKRRADGGTKANKNLVMACHSCNTRRGEMPVDQYRQHISSLVAQGIHPTLHPGAVGGGA